jgi:cutinase
MTNLSSVRKPLALAAGATLAAAGAALLPAAGAQAATTCTDVQVVFARGSGELAGLGIVGTPLVSAITGDLTGKSVSSYAVNYGASYDQSSAGAGATDMTNHITSVAAACPNTSFVVGGYSQGASVTDIALGVPNFLGAGSSISTSLAPRIKAVVVFGNPLGMTGGHIPTSSTLYGAKAKEFCNSGDPVCGAGFNVIAHLMYAFDGSATTGATFAANLVKAG